MKKIQLSKNDFQISVTIENETENAQKINTLITSVETFLNRKLNPKEVQELSEHRLEFVKVEFMKTAEFPNLTFDFNLDAVGKKAEYKELIGQIKALNLLSQFLTIQDGKAIVLTKEIDEHFTRYTTTDEQLEAYKFGMQLCNLINDNLDKPFFDNRVLFAHIGEAIPLLMESNNKITVNLDRISIMGLGKIR